MFDNKIYAPYTLSYRDHQSVECVYASCMCIYMYTYMCMYIYIRDVHIYMICMYYSVVCIYIYIMSYGTVHYVLSAP